MRTEKTFLMLPLRVFLLLSAALLSAASAGVTGNTELDDQKRYARTVCRGA